MYTKLRSPCPVHKNICSMGPGLGRLLRITLLGTSVNKAKNEGRSPVCSGSGPFRSAARAALLLGWAIVRRWGLLNRYPHCIY